MLQLKITVFQRDLDYRKQWDTSVVKLEVHDRDPEGTSELVYWESYYPVSYL